MKKFLTEKQEAILVATIACLCMIGGLIYDVIIDEGFWTLIGLVACLGIMLVYAVIKSHQREKPLYDRAKRIRAIREKNGDEQVLKAKIKAKKETNKGLAVISFLVCFIVAAFCCLEGGCTGAGIVFLAISTIILVAIRMKMESNEGNNKKGSAPTESKQ